MIRIVPRDYRRERRQQLKDMTREERHEYRRALREGRRAERNMNPNRPNPYFFEAADGHSPDCLCRGCLSKSQK